MIIDIDNFMQIVSNSDKSYDKDKIYSSYLVAEKAHRNQKRVSGDNYITHPISVAAIIIELGMDTDSICACLLHDVVEDTDVTIEDIKKEFGKDVSCMVDGVTKLGKVPLTTEKEAQAENIRKMFLAMSKDIRVVIIKLADRLHNMKTLKYMKPQKQRDKALETMEIYSPLAHRLGIRWIKEELEDLALKYLDNFAYGEIEKTMLLNQIEREKFINIIKINIDNKLLETGLKSEIQGRVKSFYGIYRKVYIAGKSFEEVYDIYALRVIVNNISECYNVLGIVHDIFKPIPNRFKDYISTPKPNMYQSLHTTVIGNKGIPFEVQIRTWDMHYTAEYGIAAHWKYKAGVESDKNLDDRLSWIRKMIESQKEADDIDDIVSSIKDDIGFEEVFVYTPNGELKSLPFGSTIIDFAYSIHSEVGHRMIGSKINGKIVPISTKLITGQIIEIITTKNENHSPSKDWLKLAKTSEARNKIRSWYKNRRREENILEGRESFEKELKKSIKTSNDKFFLDCVCVLKKRYHFESEEDLFAAIGYGGISLLKIIQKIKEDYILDLERSRKEKINKVLEKSINKNIDKTNNGIIVENIDNCLVKFSKCCNPLPGDDIIGFITRGFGVSIHQKTCLNIEKILNNIEEVGRLVNVSWSDTKKNHFRSTISITASGSNSMLADISVSISSFKVPIHSAIARELKDGNSNILITFGINGIDQLNDIIEKLNKINGLISIIRVGNKI